MKETYAAAGVSIDTADKVKDYIKKQAATASRPEVLSGVGFFGALFEFKGYRNPVLVSSVDGVGTKLKIAEAMDKYDTVGMDIVNHCVNDIFTSGAEPLFFLDYIAMGRLVPQKVAAIVDGLARACREAGCALIGGETAEMPGIYHGEDYDLAGFIVGVVEKDKVIMGQSIVPGDIILGLPSSGPHTNGYSLVRRVFGEGKADMAKVYPELGRSIGEALLEPHRPYYRMLKPYLSDIKGLAHITGGGLPGNVNRVLPEGVTAVFHQKKWPVPPLFQLIEKQGGVARAEMYHVFNMGVGMTVIAAPEAAGRLTAALPEARVIGEIVPLRDNQKVIIRQ